MRTDELFEEIEHRIRAEMEKPPIDTARRVNAGYDVEGNYLAGRLDGLERALELFLSAGCAE